MVLKCLGIRTPDLTRRNALLIFEFLAFGNGFGSHGLGKHSKDALMKDAQS